MANFSVIDRKENDILDNPPRPDGIRLFRQWHVQKVLPLSDAWYEKDRCSDNTELPYIKRGRAVFYRERDVYQYLVGIGAIEGDAA